MVCLVGVIGVVITLVDSLVAQHADLVIVLAGGFIDPLVFIEGVNGRCQIFLVNGSVVA